MDQQRGVGSRSRAGGGDAPVKFTFGSDFGLDVREKAWSGAPPAILPRLTPFYPADAHAYFHDLDPLPAGL